MLSNINFDYFYDRLRELVNMRDLSAKERFLFVFSVIKEIFSNLTEFENRYFSSFFSRTVYIFDKHNFPEELRKHIGKVRYLASELNKNPNLYCSEDNYLAALQICLNTLKLLSGLNTPDYLIGLFPVSVELDYSFIKSKSEKKDLYSFKGVVIKKDNKSFPVITLEIDSTEYIHIRLSDKWKDLYSQVWKGVELNIIDCELRDEETLLYGCAAQTIIVLMPDYLFDVTDLSECFQQKGANILLYILKKFLPHRTGLPLMIGNIINSMLDELLYDSETDFDDLLINSMKYKPLQLFALAAKQPEAVHQIRTIAANHFNSLQRTIEVLEYDNFLVEPSFMSPDYGLQGRLDVLLEYDDDPNRKNVIELKSGSAPNTDIAFKIDENKSVRAGIWHNHFAQITCYNMLLDSTYKDRKGNSQILYSSAIEYPLRDAPNVIQKKQDIIKNRNWAVSIEYALTQKQYSVFELINHRDFGDFPPYLLSQLKSFESFYSGLEQHERDYFHSAVTFILNELFFEKTGSDEFKHRKGFSSLWKDSYREKQLSLTIISNLILDIENSDFDKLHLHFDRSEDISKSQPFRKGDMIILYPLNDETKINPLSGQIIKGTIKEISPEKLIISIRNKLFKTNYFTDNNYWALEHDHLDTNTKNLFKQVYSLLTTEKRKRDLFFGISEPQSEEITVSYEELSDYQNKLIGEAVGAQDYYLLQGPPGTGKTSYMLRYLIKYIFENTEDRILLVAYTNRAVDEIGNALKRLDPDFEFIRLGSKESSMHDEHIIANLADKMRLRELQKIIKKSRVFLSTVSSLNANPEIFEIHKFNIAIIDEAAQILEPQLVGIISKVDRFIMIGDEKQLPAVVSQSKGSLNISDNSLIELGFTSFSESFFERLVRNAVKKQLPGVVGLLNRQGRMHDDIMFYANKLIYEDKLQCLEEPTWQHDSENIFKQGKSSLAKILSEKRVVFINTPRENLSKRNVTEAKLAADIINLVSELEGIDFSPNSIGVISPFRMQCAEITSLINNELHPLVTIDTVERYQGSERNTIIISYAINSPNQTDNAVAEAIINGKKVDRKLNVAITRACRNLIILGNASALSDKTYFAEFVDLIKQNGKYVEYDELIS